MPEDKHGLKWACQPCIRGHRSTKCQHWDRFMVKVKKPGRPLSICPHTKDTCTCFRSAVMMMRVMKDSKCFCAPAIKSNKPRRKPSSSADEESKTPEPDSELPEEDAKTPREDAQPQSSDEIALESPKDQVLNSEASPVRKGFGSCCVAKTKESTSETKPLETQQSQDVPQVQAESTTPQHGSETSDHISSEESPILPSTEVDKECRSSTPTVEDKEQNDDTEPTAKNTTGCCSPIPHTHQELSQSMANLSPILKDPDPIPQVEQHPLVQQNPTYVGPDLEAHQDNYTAILPANHPHGPEEYLPQTANTEFQYNYNIPASHAMVPRQILMQEPYSTMWSHENMNVSADNSAACLCGDGCECLGCPVHPFNNTTRNEVRELNDILEADMAAEYDAQNLPNQLDGSILTSPVEASARFQDFRRGSNFQYGYDVQYSRPPSNHAAAAVISSPPEYDTFQFVFQYCMGRADICLCGPGCACPGCLTHNNAPTPGGYRNLIHQGADMSMNTHPPNPMAMISNSFVLPNVAANPIQDQYQTHYQNQFHGGFKGSARYPDSNQPPPPLDMLDPADIPFQQRSMPQ